MGPLLRADDGVVSRGWRARAPFVDSSRVYDAVPSIGCGGGPSGAAELTGVGAPMQYRATHLSFNATGVQDGSRRHGRWTRIDRTVGATTITMFYEERHADEAAVILESARQVPTDHHGCETSSPIQAGEFAQPDAAFDVASVDAVDRISVCQYDLGRKQGTPGLMGSRKFDGAAAAELLDAIKQAPIGGGPDEPQNCVDDLYGDTAVVLRLQRGDTTSDMHVYYEWCFGNGFDDGTHLRELTTASCRPLIAVPPVLHTGGSSAPFQRCNDEIPGPATPGPATTVTGG